MGVERPGTSSSRTGTAVGRARSRCENLTSVANKLKTPMYVSDRAMPSEAETIRAIEELLTIPTIGGRLEVDLVQEAVGTDGLVTDPDFPPGPSALYQDPHMPPASAPEGVAWRRVSGNLYVPTGGRPPRLLQGSLANNAWLGALSAVACKQDLLLDLVVSDDHASQGVYTFQLYKHGSWHQVVVDNFLPCIEGEDRLAFACSGQVGELWPSLIEKAAAKVVGSFYGLEGGSVAEALVDLTGGVATKTDLSSASVQQAALKGMLWKDLCGWLTSSCIVAVMAKRKRPAGSGGGGYPSGDDDDEGVRLGEEPSGLLTNHVYTVLDARQLGEHTRLLRVHCPWPAGGWRGAWADGSREWGQVPGLWEQLGAPNEGDGSFWITYTDFIEVFNRLYVCRLFPPTWHQLTLHCGWSGPSAGGPYVVPPAPPGGLYGLDLEAQASQRDGGGAGGTEEDEASETSGTTLSSTWCCNPQFRVTVRRSAEVIVCLAQQDPQVQNRGHVPKRLRKRMVGMQVLRLPADSLGRRWDIKANELLQEVPLSAGREVTASFRADPEYAYVIVPYARRAGEEGAFVLRSYSSAPLEMEQLPSPLSLVLGGAWMGQSAGGRRGNATWGSNSQYMISTQHRTQVVISITRLDLKYSVLKPDHNPDQCIALTLVLPDKPPEGGGLGRKMTVISEAEVVAECEYRSMEEAVLMATLDPEAPYLLVPSIFAPGMEAPFELRLMSSVPVELVALPEAKVMVVSGEWREDNSGGCDLNPLWRKNPRFLLMAEETTKCRVCLSKLGRRKQGRSSVDDMLGFYLLKASEPSGEVRGDLRKAIVRETTFVPQAEVKAEYELQAGVVYVVMPCTYSPGRLGRFNLAIMCPTEFHFSALEH